jgi:hypothetical protein
MTIWYGYNTKNTLIITHVSYNPGSEYDHKYGYNTKNTLIVTHVSYNPGSENDH